MSGADGLIDHVSSEDGSYYSQNHKTNVWRWLLARRVRLLSTCAYAVVFLARALSAQQATPPPLHPDVHPHASTAVTKFTQSAGIYTIEHPSDWQAHEDGARVNIGASDGLVPGERGFRTIYGAIVTIADDPLAGTPERSLEASTRAIVEAVLKRNAHQSLKSPVHVDGMMGGAPAATAVLVGVSPVTGRGERAEIVCRQYGSGKIFYVILVSPTNDYDKLDAALKRIRDSVKFSDR